MAYVQFMQKKRMKCIHGQLTTAQVKANSRKGTIILPDETGRKITVWDGWLRSDGNASGATAVVVTDNAATPIVAFAMAVGGLTAATVARVGVATHYTGTTIGQPLTGGKGLRIGCTVADLATTTVLDYCIFYTVES